MIIVLLGCTRVQGKEIASSTISEQGLFPYKPIQISAYVVHMGLQLAEFDCLSPQH